jgi:hypothetical protein
LRNAPIVANSAVALWLAVASKPEQKCVSLHAESPMSGASVSVDPRNHEGVPSVSGFIPESRIDSGSSKVDMLTAHPSHRERLSP